MKRLALLAVLTLLMGTNTLALADTTATTASAAAHPRITEVHARMKEQFKRIQAGVKNGTLTQDQANALLASLKAVRAQMKADFAANGNKELTEDQLKQLNQMLDENSKTIYGEKHPDSSASGSTTGPSSSGNTGSTSNGN